MSIKVYGYALRFDTPLHHGKVKKKAPLCVSRTRTIMKGGVRMTSFIGGFVAALLMIAAIACLIWALNELDEERRKTKDLEIKVAQMEANRMNQKMDIK